VSRIIFPANTRSRPGPLGSDGITHPSSLLRAHVQVLRPPFHFAFRLIGTVFAACVIHGGSEGPSQLILLFFPKVLRPRRLRRSVARLIGGLPPLPRVWIECACPFLPRSHRPRLFPTVLGSLPIPPQTASRGESFSERQTFRYVTALPFVRLPDRSYRYLYQRRRLYPQSLPRVCYRPLSLINYPTEPDNCWDGTFTR
jgi:hypothetical protein